VQCFFFQAEDGIRDLIVTGVQTCALPISLIVHIDGGYVGKAELALQEDAVAGLEVIGCAGAVDDAVDVTRGEPSFGERFFGRLRSEERRVGKECRSRNWP